MNLSIYCSEKELPKTLIRNQILAMLLSIPSSPEHSKEHCLGPFPEPRHSSKHDTSSSPEIELRLYLLWLMIIFYKTVQP